MTQLKFKEALAAQEAEQARLQAEEKRRAQEAEKAEVKKRVMENPLNETFESILQDPLFVRVLARLRDLKHKEIAGFSTRHEYGNTLEGLKMSPLGRLVVDVQYEDGTSRTLLKVNFHTEAITDQYTATDRPLPDVPKGLFYTLVLKDADGKGEESYYFTSLEEIIAQINA